MKTYKQKTEKELKRWVQFANANWFNPFDEKVKRFSVKIWEEYDVYWDFEYHTLTMTHCPAMTSIFTYDRIPLFNVITSSQFIEAVARGVSKETNVKVPQLWTLYSCVLHSELVNRKWIINEITTQQAIAIRDNKLPEFINNILPKE